MRGTGILTLLISSGILVLIFYWLTNLYAFSFARPSTNILYREFYECGFKAIPDIRIAIDLQFSILGLIFLLYDMEIVVIVPVVLNILSFPLIAQLSLLVALIILGLSYWYEWERFALHWGFN
jgi:NADH:ubiquinone oxidoreductase subunit 3 (subunit A)